MREIIWEIKDEFGIHARPAGLLVKEAAKFSSDIFIIKGEKEADGKKLFSVMGLGAKKGDTITVKILGTDEDSAETAMKKFLEENL